MDNTQPYEKTAAELKETYKKDIFAYRAKTKPNAAKKKRGGRGSRLKRGRGRKKWKRMRRMKRMKKQGKTKMKKT